VQTKGGSLLVQFEKEGVEYVNIWLRGPATFVFEAIPDPQLLLP